MRDNMHSLNVLRVLSPVVVSDNTAQVGQIIDNQGADSLTYIINTATLADVDATFAVTLQEGDAANLSDAATVADIDMLSAVRGTAPLTAGSFTFAADDAIMRLGYIGNKRYTRITITPSANTGSAPMSVIAIRGHLRFRPS